jgi:hypothetical protein
VIGGGGGQVGICEWVIDHEADCCSVVTQECTVCLGEMVYHDCSRPGQLLLFSLLVTILDTIL